MNSPDEPVSAKGKPLSYAQNLEDYHLWLALGAESPGVYIDIGGGHPVADNVSMWFYERGWHGLVVEPQSVLARMYAAVRPRDIVHDGLVGRTTGTAELHVFPRLHGLSTTVRPQADNATALGDQYETVALPMVTLAELCRTHAIDRIDFLKIDVEGAEADVLAGNDWRRNRPKIVVIEAIDAATKTPSHETWEDMLLGAGYRFRLDDTLNRFYVAEECPEVFERLPDTRAPWDVVTHMYEIGRAPVDAGHPDHALAMDLTRGFWASLPALDRQQLTRFLMAARHLDETSPEADAVRDMLKSEAGSAALGRIACGYDGGQI